MEVKLEQKDVSDWVYRGEGAANLVLAYSGSSPLFIGKVMRIQKVAINSSSKCLKSKPALTELERMLWKESEELISSPSKEIAEQLYVQHVMAPLLGPKHVDAGVRALVTKEFLESIEEKVNAQRPAWRVETAKVDTNRDTVILMSDHSLFPHGALEGGPCLSVEIKPKCGFLPLSKYVDDKNAIKRSITRFAMHQILKWQQQQITELSQYNPLELFSGSKESIRKAINDLYSTPQNNFRVFLNGSLIFGGLGGGMKKTNAVIAEAFEDALRGIIKAENGLRTRSFVQLVSEAVYSSRLLDQLLEVQKLDDQDIEGAIHAYYNVISEPCVICKVMDEASISMPQKYTTLHSISMDESLKIVKDYLIAATAKDCSLMISFRPKTEGDFQFPYCSIHLESTNQSFDYKANFIDLDLKPLKKMEDYYELDKKIVNCYIQMMGNEQRKENFMNMECESTNEEATIL